MTKMTARFRFIHLAFAIGVLVAAGSAASAYAISRTSRAALPPAQSLVSSLADSATVVATSALPASFANIPTDSAPAAGSVHRLIAAPNGGALYAWADRANRVCDQDSNGNGGCLGAFTNPISYFISDPDGLRTGSAPYVIGLAQDGVSSVSVSVDGKYSPAELKNNAFYLELPNASLTTEDVNGFRVTLADGSTETISHDGLLPPGLG